MNREEEITKNPSSLHVLGLVVLSMFSFIGPMNSGIRVENVKNGDFSSFYAYDRSLSLNAAEDLIVDEDTYKVYKVYFDSVNGERVPALLSIPEGRENIPCIVFLHGYGGSKEDILSTAGPIAAEAYAIMAIDAEFHGERMEKGKELYSKNLNESRNGIIQTVIDLRRAVDYLEMRTEIDRAKIGYVGGSMGGILGAIFIGVESRIKAAALLVAGGNMSLMIKKSRHYTMPAIREYLEAEGIPYEEIQKFLDPVDPINFIDKFSPRPVVFHLGKYDEIVPAEAGEQLYRRAKEPKSVYWYDSGHSLPLELVLARILDFMDRELLGKKLVFHETKYWISKHIASILIGIGGILSIACVVHLIRRRVKRG
ncbi:MAG: alpha/beta hydrolase family protein [Candidatus Bathyarchaeia archaeon]